MAAAAIQQVTDSTFEQLVKSSTPTLIDFWAEWCMPCRRVAPVVDALATEYAGRLNVAKMNVDENQNVPIRLGIQSIPTLMIFKDGNLVDMHVGATDKDVLRKMVDKHVK
ncbi:MAG TPA: thioredoxin [Vicinamibacterales bacterium]|nr:thioredoxin [Acidobacteriota bacterium]HOC17004.1 thioredoxin [Vicinamibacterales bacterium]